MRGDERVDVTIIGGGPAGSTAAALLARAGHGVVVLERERFPRYHIGESLLSATLPILAHSGALPAVERAGFVKKPGGTFLWGVSGEPWSFYFQDDPGGYAHAFHVLRSEFDEILLRHAQSLGADVREGHAVLAVETAGPCVARWRDESGNVGEIRSSYLVDASGPQALLGRSHGLREFHPFFRGLAIWSYLEGVDRLPAPDRDNLFTAAYEDGWFWVIPLRDGTTSVGTVIDADRFRERARGVGLDALYDELLTRCAPVAAMTASARRVAPVRVTRDYAYSSRSFTVGRALLAGDAACFVDPVFSTGVHLACLAGLLAAHAIDEALAERADAGEALAGYDAALRRAFDRFQTFVAYFYNHHAAAGSSFWKSRKLLDPSGDLGPREAFVQLVAGTKDPAGLADAVNAVDEQWRQSIARCEARQAPGMKLLRVSATLAEMRRLQRSD